MAKGDELALWRVSVNGKVVCDTPAASYQEALEAAEVQWGGEGVEVGVERKECPIVEVERDLQELEWRDVHRRAAGLLAWAHHEFDRLEGGPSAMVWMLNNRRDAVAHNCPRLVYLWSVAIESDMLSATASCLRASESVFEVIDDPASKPADVPAPKGRGAVGLADALDLVVH